MQCEKGVDIDKAVERVTCNARARAGASRVCWLKTRTRGLDAALIRSIFP
jgi:hypothetical protein